MSGLGKGAPVGATGEFDEARAGGPCAFLGSVIDASEAQICVAGGVDIVDCKDPNAGALGALDADAVRDIVRAVDGSVPVSATVGDLPCDGRVLCDAVLKTSRLGVDYVKVGFFADAGADASEGRQQIRSAVAALGALELEDVGLVAVMLADGVFDAGLLDDFARAGFCGVIVDTADKASGSLFDILQPAEIERCIDTAHGLGLFCGLAGRLRLDDVPAALSFGPDIIGFRGALCARGAREAGLDPRAVCDLRARIPRSSCGPGRSFARPRASFGTALVS